MTAMEIIQQLAKKHHHNPEENKLYEALQKGVPEAEVIKAGKLWLSKNPADWSAAVNLICQYTSPFGKYFHNSRRPIIQQQRRVIYLAPLDQKTTPAVGQRRTGTPRRRRKTKREV